MALKNENADLKNILGRKNNSQKEILATILAKPFFSPYDTLVIDLGSADGIAVGDQVIALGNTYIGKISEVYSHSSKVTLYSSSGETIDVLVGTSTVEKTATGMGGGNFSLQMPVGSNVNIGDPIIIPSISANIFSTVEKIDSEPTDSFETVLFKNPVNISELQYVEVVPADNTIKRIMITDLFKLHTSPFCFFPSAVCYFIFILVLIFVFDAFIESILLGIYSRYSLWRRRISGNPFPLSFHAITAILFSFFHLQSKKC